MKNSEWFQFKESYLQQINQYLSCCKFVIGKIEFNDIPKAEKRSILETNYYPKNTENFIVDKTTKNEALDAIQKPAIQTLIQFINSDTVAGQLIAPCGSGKTMMTCKAIASLSRLVICVPSLRIQEQWNETVDRNDCLFLGGDADDWSTIETSLKKDSFCIITTYMSCKHLLEILPVTTELIVFDEAHHMTGLVSDDKEKGQGITRVLLKTLVDKNMKRLFLTFTPKDVVDNDEDMVMSMDDETVFGKAIVEIKLRDLINQGVLPDYVIWALSSDGTGLYGKLEQTLLAWNSGEINHLIIFVKDLDDKDKVKEFLKDKVDCPLLSVDRPQDAKRVFDEFHSERAILIDCRRLGEGVDIPIADSVAILYPKQSVADIVQMVLRAGRWYDYKSVFHILLPHVANEDMSGIQNVIVALAKYDDALRGEVLFSSQSKPKTDNVVNDRDTGTSSASRIQSDMISSTDIEKMHECFQTIRERLVHKTNRKAIQKLCIQRNVTTQKDYILLQSEMTHLPDNPLFGGTTWFDYLNPNTEKIDVQVFVKTLNEANKGLPSDYIDWYQQVNYPSLQNIRDGYFGEDQTNFIQIVETFAPLERRRR
jgi:predicted helicase